MSADVPESSFYECLTHGLIMIANYPALVKLTRKSNLAEKRLKVITLEIPDNSAPQIISKTKIAESDLNAIVESMKDLQAYAQNVSFGHFDKCK